MLLALGVVNLNGGVLALPDLFMSTVYSVFSDTLYKKCLVTSSFKKELNTITRSGKVSNHENVFLVIGMSTDSRCFPVERSYFYPSVIQ